MINNEILQYLIKNGIFDCGKDASLQVEMKKKDILKKHNHNIHYDEKKKLWKSYLGNQKPYRQISGKTKEGLEEKIIEYYLSDVSKRKTFLEVYEEWMRHELTVENPTICKKSVNNYKNVFENYLRKSNLCNIVFDRIGADDLRNFCYDLIDNNRITRKRYNEIKSLIGKIFAYGIRIYRVDFPYSYSGVFRDLKFNASQFLEPIEKERIYYPEEIEKLVFYIVEHPTIFNYCVLLNLELGLRVSEISCLEFESFANDHFHVAKAEHSYSLDGHRMVYIDLPKKKKTGDVYLTYNALMLWNCVRIMHPTNTGYVLLDESGERMTTRQIDYQFGKLCKLAGIKNKGFHKLRITCSSVLQEKLPEILVRDNLRHADVSTTKRHYSYNPNNAAGTAAKFSSVSALDITGHYLNQLQKNASNADFIGI